METVNHIFIECPFNDDLKNDLKQWARNSAPPIMDNFLNILDSWIPTSGEAKSQYDSINTAPWFRGFISLSITTMIPKDTSVSLWIQNLNSKCANSAYEIWIRRCVWFRDSGHLWEDYMEWIRHFRSTLDNSSDNIDFPSTSSPLIIQHIDHALLS
jgi:hypothetical protein